MHFSYIYILQDYTLEDVSSSYIEDKYCEGYCDCCGERFIYDEENDEYQAPEEEICFCCDWFQIGGRWGGLLKAKKGILGERSWTNEKEVYEPNSYDIVEIKDLIEPINEECICGFVISGECPEENAEDVKEMIRRINNKEINGVIAMIDNHN